MWCWKSRPRAPSASAASRPELLVLAARSPSALEQMRVRLADHLAANPDVPLADIAFTLQRGRRHFPHRVAVACRDHADAQALLSGPLSPRVSQGEAPADAAIRRLHVPGTGSAIRRDGARALPGACRRSAAELDRCAEILSAENIDLIDALYGPDDPSRAERLARTGAAQPAIFSVSYALARLWQSWGVNAQAYIGHSVGEFVAACLAGVFSLPDALRLIAARGRLMQAAPSGRHAQRAAVGGRGTAADRRGGRARGDQQSRRTSFSRDRMRRFKRPCESSRRAEPPIVCCTPRTRSIRR